jgi:hypothetical protein
MGVESCHFRSIADTGMVTDIGQMGMIACEITGRDDHCRFPDRMEEQCPIAQQKAGQIVDQEKLKSEMHRDPVYIPLHQGEGFAGGNIFDRQTDQH